MRNSGIMKKGMSTLASSELSFDHYYVENKTYNVKSLFPKTNCAIYVFPTKAIRRNFSTIAKSKVRFMTFVIFHWPQLRTIDQEVVAKLAEVDMIIADLDRANSRIAALEHRNVSLTFMSSFLWGNPIT